MKVEQIMNKAPKVCHPHDSLSKAAQLMWDSACGGIPVVDEHSKPVGFLTDRDVCMAAYTQGKILNELRVETAMARKVAYCRAADDLHVAADVMRSRGVRRLPVVGDDGSIVGVLSLDDIAHEAARPLRGGVNQELKNLVAEVFMAINRGHVKVHPAA